MLAGGGLGRIGEARHSAWYYLSGGVLGAAYVTSVLVTVRSLGAGGVVAATIAGQLTSPSSSTSSACSTSQSSPITALRVLGLVLLALGVWLIVRE